MKNKKVKRGCTVYLGLFILCISFAEKYGYKNLFSGMKKRSSFYDKEILSGGGE